MIRLGFFAPKYRASMLPTTGGNLVFSSVINRLLAYRADTGEQVFDLDTHLSQMGPPMTFMLDGKQGRRSACGPPS